MRKGLIYSSGEYPIGSRSNVTRLWVEGFRKNDISTELIIMYPPPTKVRLNNVENFVKFMHISTDKKINRVSSIVYIIRGVFNGYKYLVKRKEEIGFVVFALGGLFEISLIFLFCKKNKIKIFIDIVDENSKKFKEGKRTVRDYFAILNKELRDRLIIPKVDALFVLTSYLQKKYKSIAPSLNIIRTIPGIVDYSDFLKLQKQDIHQIPNLNTEVFKSNRVKIFYPGSCVRTNGLKFFLECSASILRENISIFDIIFIFHIGDIGKIEQICESLNIVDRVIILPPVLPQYLPAIYKHVDILVLPEHGDTIANAGFPGKTAEYLASGKAVISTIFSDLTDYLINDYNAMLSPIGDYETYTNNLKYLLSSKELREKLGKNAIVTAQKFFDNKNSVKKYIDEIYKA